MPGRRYQTSENKRGKQKNKTKISRSKTASMSPKCPCKPTKAKKEHKCGKKKKKKEAAYFSKKKKVEEPRKGIHLPAHPCFAAGLRRVHI